MCYFMAFPGEAVGNSVAIGKRNGMHIEGEPNMNPKLILPTRRKGWDF
jgi:hypothetical protein